MKLIKKSTFLVDILLCLHYGFKTNKTPNVWSDGVHVYDGMQVCVLKVLGS